MGIKRNVDRKSAQTCVTTVEGNDATEPPPGQTCKAWGMRRQQFAPGIQMSCTWRHPLNL
eukprot:6202155-Pleurochrysis_carterae.AAC.5